MAEWMSATDLARHLGCSSQVIYMAFKQGHLLKGGYVERGPALDSGPTGKQGARPRFFFRHIPQDSPVDQRVWKPVVWADTKEPVDFGPHPLHERPTVAPGYRSQLVPQGPLRIVEDEVRAECGGVTAELEERVTKLEALARGLEASDRAIRTHIDACLTQQPPLWQELQADQHRRRLAELEDELQRANDALQTLRVREAKILHFLLGDSE